MVLWLAMCRRAVYFSRTMSTHACPWWLGYLLITPLRRLKENPAKILAPLVRSGMTAVEPGPGMGYFTLELARRVGPQGASSRSTWRRKCPPPCAGE
jgi:hypothetical protein